MIEAAQTTVVIARVTVITIVIMMITVRLTSAVTISHHVRVISNTCPDIARYHIIGIKVGESCHQ